MLRGTAASPWDLRPWEDLAADFDVTVLVPANNLYDTGQLRLRRQGIRTAGARLAGAGAPGRLLLRAVGERYLGLRHALQDADIVHAAELGNWYTAQAAALRPGSAFRLAVTVWETLPFVDAYRNIRTRPYRRRVLQATDVFLPATERARTALRLEGVTADRTRLCPPGVAVEPYDTSRTPRLDGHLVLSIGRLVWEKGHQDVLRAVALLRDRGRRDVRVLIVGTGPERRRLQRVASDLGLAGAVEFRGWVPHDRLSDIYAGASCLVLASQPTWFWEEQFGMVLVEAMAAHVPVVAAASGAIPEVVGDAGDLFGPGDWVGLAGVLETGPLAGPRAVRRAPTAERLERYSSRAAGDRLRAVYDELLS